MLLVGRGWSTSSAAPVALAVAVVLATTLFQTPLRTIAVAAGKGIWDAIFVLYAVWPALILYQVANGARAFDAIRRGVSLGAPWLALASVVDMPDPSFTLRIGALMVWIADLLVLPIGMLVASAAGLAAALALSRWSFYRQEDTDEPDRIFARNQSEPSEAEARPDGLQGGHCLGAGKRTIGRMGSRSDCRGDLDDHVARHALGRQRAGIRSTQKGAVAGSLTFPLYPS